MSQVVKVLVVDDSAVFRSQIKGALAGVPEIEVVGTANNGKEALSKIIETPVDVAIVDVEMPEMNGIEFLEALNEKKIQVRVIMFASATKTSAISTLKALNRGAFDFVLKPNDSQSTASTIQGHIRNLLTPKILAKLNLGVSKAPTLPAEEKTILSINWTAFKPDAILIGCSTGGPGALEKLFSNFNDIPNCPILIVQHMPPLFTAALADHLSAISKIPFKEAADQDIVLPGRGYIAPGNFHMVLSKDSTNQIIVNLNQQPQRHSVRPAVDFLFETAAPIYGKKCLSFILTGMGDDGRDGCLAIKKYNGAVVIQEESSCVVYGMPKAVRDSGAFDKEINLAEIRDLLKRYSTPISGERLVV